MLPWQIRQKKAGAAVLKNALRQVNLPVAMLDKNISELSGGEKQRVALLRNLQFPPAILLLDEITSALDEENKQVVNQLIKGQVKEQGTAVLWVSHDSTEISQAARIIRLCSPQGESCESA